jgi:hypothetical protein
VAGNVCLNFFGLFDECVWCVFALTALWIQHSQMKPRFHHLLLVWCDWEIYCHLCGIALKNSKPKSFSVLYAPQQTPCQLNLLMVRVLRPPEPERLVNCYKITMACVSVDGLKCYTSVFRGKKGVASRLYLLLFESHFKYFGVFSSTPFTQKEPWHFWEVILWQGFGVKG